MITLFVAARKGKVQCARFYGSPEARVSLRISVLTVPMADLAGPVVVEPPNPDDPDEAAFVAELRDDQT